MGLPNLSEPDRLRVESGNACLEAAVKLVNVFHSAGLPWILENPHASKMWWHPRLEQLHSDSLVTVVVAVVSLSVVVFVVECGVVCGVWSPLLLLLVT